MKSGLWLVTGTVGLIMSVGLSPVAAREASTEIPDVQVPRSGCVTYKINPKRLYAPFKVQVFSRNFFREFLFEDTSDEVFDKSVSDTNVLADSTVSVNYIDRNGRVVPGETETGVSSENQVDCSVKLKLDFGLTAEAGSFEILNAGAGFQIAEDYYGAIDPDGKKTTLNDWKRENDFFVVNTPTSSEEIDPTGPDVHLPQPSVAPTKPKAKSLVRKGSPDAAGGIVLGQIEKSDFGDDASAIYFNHGDLGFGRDMHMKRSGKNNKNLAFYVTNYRSLENAINRANPIATVAMEYSFGSRKGKDKSRYIQFYAFDAEGGRLFNADLDGRGEKYLPQLCMTCHGGMQGERNLTSGEIPESGGLGARFLPFDLNALNFSDTNSSYSRAAQEAAFKVMNVAILDALPTPAMEQLIIGWYSDQILSPHFESGPQPRVKRSKPAKGAGAKTRPRTDLNAQSASQPNLQAQSGTTTGLNRATQNSSYVPVRWRGEHAELYTEIVAPYCRGCHITRQNDLDWNTYEEFANDAGRIKHRVCQNDDLSMPNAKATYQNMWLSAIDPIDVLTRHGIFTLSASETCGQGPWARP